GPAANARIALVVERIVRHVMLEDKRPDVLLGPLQERVDLHQAEFGVPLDNAGAGAVGRLVAADRTDPGVVAGDGAAQRHNLAVVAGLVSAVAVERAAVLGLVLGHGLFGSDKLDLDAVAVLQPVAHLQRFGKLVAGVEVENAYTGFDLCEHVDDAAALGPKRGRHGEARVEFSHRPAQNLLWGLSFQVLISDGNVFRREGVRNHKLLSFSQLLHTSRVHCPVDEALKITDANLHSILYHLYRHDRHFVKRVMQLQLFV